MAERRGLRLEGPRWLRALRYRDELRVVARTIVRAESLDPDFGRGTLWQRREVIHWLRRHPDARVAPAAAACARCRHAAIVFPPDEGEVRSRVLCETCGPTSAAVLEFSSQGRT